ncbi:hypothetical protein HMPREF0877_1490 [Weissella paramesenteroides ATCC 33313]|uniref:Uncharacterized protein n=1 Tax=Weissella paramesenteroides ATCC 33313 TaxID=585506 RepID=C5RBZ4_WEIPA|nr:hypothetical protein HMPREF0877_1490 [Weissella paramesenteroides ATCC 33313]
MLIKLKDTTPIRTISSKLFVRIAVITVGIDAIKFGQSMLGRWPMC